MTVWGVDLGVRSASLAALDPDGHLELISIGSPTPKGRVSDQQPTARAVELGILGEQIARLVAPGDTVFVEEPPCAGSKNLRTFGKLSMAAGALVAYCPAPTVLVEVDTWKKAVIGKGGVSKAVISEYLAQSHPDYAAMCHHDQNLVDATCIALYGANHYQESQ